MAMQLHGGGGLSDDFPLAGAWTAARALRLADGPDEVHRGVVARLELGKYGRRCDDDEGPGHRRRLRAGRRAHQRVPGARGRGAGDRPGPAVDLTLDITSDEDWAAALAHVERDAGAASTCWSTTPASPAAAGSTSPRWTSGSGSRHQPVRRGPRHPHVRPAAQAPALGPHRQRRLARRARAPGRDGVVQRRQGRGRRAHRDDRARARGVRRARQRRLPVVLPHQPDVVAARRGRRQLVGRGGPPGRGPRRSPRTTSPPPCSRGSTAATS